MKEKCNKYEQLINFGTEEELLRHISECEDCKQEHKKMLAVSSLINEAKPYYLKKKQEIKKLKVACVMLFTLFSSVTFGVLDSNYKIMNTLSYNDGITLEDMGFPTDDYGFIMVD